MQPRRRIQSHDHHRLCHEPHEYCSPTGSSTAPLLVRPPPPCSMLPPCTASKPPVAPRCSPLGTTTASSASAPPPVAPTPPADHSCGPRSSGEVGRGRGRRAEGEGEAAEAASRWRGGGECRGDGGDGVRGIGAHTRGWMCERERRGMQIGQRGVTTTG